MAYAFINLFKKMRTLLTSEHHLKYKGHCIAKGRYPDCISDASAFKQVKRGIFDRIISKYL